MARNKAPYASIFHLYALIRLYTHSYGINPPPDTELDDPHAEKKYIDALSNRLIQSNVVSSGSRHLTNKLRGFPYQSSADECNEGIDVDRLDLLSKIVLERYSEKIKIENPSSSPWSDFQNLFVVPDYFEGYQKYKYYKYLRPHEQDALKAFVERKINEMDLGVNQIQTYCVHILGRNYINTNTSILQIDTKKNCATYTFYSFQQGKWIQLSAQRSEGKSFYAGNSTIFIDTIEENPNKQNIRISLFIQKKDVEFYNTIPYAEGILSSSADSAGVPMTCVCLLVKHPSYQKAYEVVTNPGSHPTGIDIELLNRRIEVNEPSLKSLEKFRTYLIAQLVKKISGAYVFGWLSKPPAGQSVSLELSKGVCFIYPNGIMKWRKYKSEEILGRVLTDTHYGHDVICFADFFSHGLHEYKYQYELRVTEKNDVIMLNGLYIGIDHLMPRTGAVVFIKKDEYKSFEEISEKIECEKLPFNKVTKEDDQIILNEIINSTSIILAGNVGNSK